MCRLLGWVSRTPMTARDVLGSGGLEAFSRLSHQHVDGWGMLSDSVDGPLVRRSTTLADDDPDFASATTAVATRAGLVHLRWATPGLPIDLHNTHPFLNGGRAFVHNGAIYPVDRVGEILAPPWRDRLGGTTDSESYFLAVLAELDESGTDVPTALARVTSRLARDFSPTSLNALLLAPDALYAISCHDPAIAPDAAPPTAGESLADDSAYFDLEYRATPQAVVVASTGSRPPEGDGWRVVPNDTVLVVNRTTLATRQVPLGSGLGAAEPLHAEPAIWAPHLRTPAPRLVRGGSGSPPRGR
jgi:predicted glutamine amidotransferase